MMAQDDFFDLTGLPFDPPEKSARKVKVAVDKKIKELNGALGSETQQVGRDDIIACIRLLTDTAEIILSEDGKKLVERTFGALAEARTQAEIGKLTATANLMAATGTCVVTEAAIKDLRRERKLSDEHVRAVFDKLGFVIQRVEVVDVTTLFPKQSKKTDEYIRALRNTKDPNPNGVDTSKVTDLYAFAAYLMAEPDNAAVYRGKTTEELLGVFDTFSKKFSQRNDNLGKLCAAIATAAKTYVFNTEENRQAYAFYLKYQTQELQELFDSMRGAPESVLLGAAFAEPCIRRIADVLDCTYEIALAVFNRESGVAYAPKAAVYLVKCGVCGSVNSYASEEEAIRSNACSNCRKALYQRCGKCGRAVLLSQDRCPYPDCGFMFANAAMFDRYFAAAEDALHRNDFEAALRNARQAQACDPTERQRTEQLIAVIREAEERYRKPLRELHTLTVAKAFVKAQAALAQILRANPGLYLADTESLIRNTVNRADAAFTAAMLLPPTERADACVRILQYCVDHEPSLGYLRITRPEAVKSFHATADPAKGCIQMVWPLSTEQGTRYHLVRKEGEVAPASVSDGIVLLEDNHSAFFCDTTLLSGQMYTYALFISRMGVFSEGVSATAMLYADVQGLRAEQDRHAVHLTWDMPHGCRGAIVTRRGGGRDMTVSMAAYGSCEDTQIQYGVAYTYTVTVCYGDGIYSPGVEAVITPMLIIDAFRMYAVPIKDTAIGSSTHRDAVYRVTWDIRKPQIDLRVLVDGVVVKECRSDAGSAEIALKKNGVYTVSVMAHSGGQWLTSDNSVTVNTYSSCAIDKQHTELNEEMIVTPKGTAYRVEVRLCLAQEPTANVAGFYYAVRTACDASRWATIQEIGKAADIRRVDIRQYRERNGITHTAMVEDERSFFVSVFTIYAVGGREIVCEPKTIKVDRIIAVEVFWRVTKPLLGPYKLTISLESHRSVERVPELVLCGCGEEAFITSPEDARAVELLHIPALDLASPQKAYTKTYELPKALCKKNMKFFLFELNPARSERYTLRWAQGFTGKV